MAEMVGLQCHVRGGKIQQVEDVAPLSLRPHSSQCAVPCAQTGPEVSGTYAEETRTENNLYGAGPAGVMILHCRPRWEGHERTQP